MSGIRRFSLLLAACLAGVSFLLSSAHAFFPETKEVADKIATRYEGLKSWRVELGLNGTSDSRIRCWRKDNLWRQKWVDASGNSSRLVRAAVGSGQRIDAVHPPSMDAPYPPLRLDWLTAPEKEWERLAIEDGVKSYQFLGDRPCIVLGAEHGDERSSQIWIDLERYVPLRLIAPSGIQWRWSEYYSLGNHLLPTQLGLVFPQGKRFVFDLEWRQVATEMDRSRFSPGELKEEFGQAVDLEVGEPRLRFLLEISRRMTGNSRQTSDTRRRISRRTSVVECRRSNPNAPCIMQHASFRILHCAWSMKHNV